VSGLLTRSPLGIREAEEVTGVPCLSVERIEDGAAFTLLGATRRLRGRALSHAPSTPLVDDATSGSRTQTDAAVLTTG